MSDAFKDISSALSARLDTISPAVPTAWENYPFTPTADTLYLRETCIQGDSDAAAIGVAAMDFTLGIYQVDIFAPLNGGKNVALEQADIVADLFKRATILTYNGVDVVITKVSRGAGAVDANSTYWHLPIFVNFYSYTNAR